MSYVVTIVDPRGKSFQYWSDLMSEQLAGLGILRGAKDHDWKDWARNLVNQPQLSSQGIPSPQNFSKWQDWAASLLNFTISY